MSQPYDDLFDEFGPEPPLADIDAIWERVAEGTATPEELADLQARATTDPEVASMLAIFTPMDDERLRRTAEQLQARLAHDEESGPQALPEERGPEALPEPANSNAGWMRMLVPVLAAVAVLLLMVRPGDPSVGGLDMRVLRAGDVELRGADARQDVVTLTEGSEVVFKFSGAGAGEVSAWLDGHPPQPLPVDVQTAAEATRATVTLNAQHPPGDRGRLVLVVHDAGTTVSVDAAHAHHWTFTWGSSDHK